MQLDSFIQLINQLRVNSINDDDTDPNNILIQKYTGPYDQVYLSDAVRTQRSDVSSLVWGNGSTYTAYDSNGNPYQAPSCGWLWGSGVWVGPKQGNFVFPWQII